MKTPIVNIDDPAGRPKPLLPKSVTFPRIKSLKQTLRYAMLAKYRVGAYLVLSVLAAMTEVVSVALLIPLLSAVTSYSGVFAGVPFLDSFSKFFVTTFPPETRLIWLAVIMFVMLIIRSILSLFAEVYRYLIPIDVERNLRLKVTEALLNAEVGYTEGLPISKIASYCVEFPARIGIAVRFAAMFLSGLIIALIYIAGLLFVDPIMALVTLTSVTLMSLAFRAVTHRRVHIVANAVTKTREEFNQNFYETVQGNIEIRLNRAQNRVIYKIQSIVDRLMKVQANNFVLELSSQPFLSALAGTAICALLVYIGLQPVAEHPKLIAPVIIFLILFSRLISPLTLINVSRHHYSLHSVTFDPYDEFLAEALQHKDQDGSHDVNDYDEISFSGVDFAYDDTKLALRDISLSIKRNAFIAIVGPSGSGKSTLAILLTRLYRPKNGEIYLGKINLEDVRADDWLARIGFARQGAFIASRTIRDVISSSDSRPEAAELAEIAAKAASIHDYIMELPEGYDTLLREQGRNLSTGQRQRMILARALYADPEVLIIDEGTSGLDAITERAILDKVYEMRGERTIIFITHALQRVKDADHIIVMDQGTVSQQGTFAELEQSEGVFRKMLYG